MPRVLCTDLLQSVLHLPEADHLLIEPLAMSLENWRESEPAKHIAMMGETHSFDSLEATGSLVVDLLVQVDVPCDHALDIFGKRCKDWRWRDVLPVPAYPCVRDNKMA
jgi:hypothetical protein